MTIAIVIGLLLLLLIAAALIPPLAALLWIMGGVVLAAGLWFAFGWGAVAIVVFVVVIVFGGAILVGKADEKIDLMELKHQSKVDDAQFREKAKIILLECYTGKISKEERNKRLAYLISQYNGKVILHGQFAHVPEQKE